MHPRIWHWSSLLWHTSMGSVVLSITGSWICFRGWASPYLMVWSNRYVHVVILHWNSACINHAQLLCICSVWKTTKPGLGSWSKRRKKASKNREQEVAFRGTRKEVHVYFLSEFISGNNKLNSFLVAESGSKGKKLPYLWWWQYCGPFQTPSGVRTAHTRGCCSSSHTTYNSYTRWSRHYFGWTTLQVWFHNTFLSVTVHRRLSKCTVTLPKSYL